MFKPHYGKCICHKENRLIVVKAGYCAEGNGEKKKKAKGERPARKRSAIPKRSERRVKLDAAYSILRKKYLSDHPYCAANIKGLCSHEATDIHHLYWSKDREKYMNDFSSVIPVCRNCHTHIHSVMSKAETIEKGFRKLDNGNAAKHL